MHPALTYPADRDRLFKLLPYVIQRKDSEQGWPLRALLQVITEQADLLEIDCWQRCENWFIETCEPWVVPYIADLIGHDPIAESEARGESGREADATVRNAFLLPRREVAHTLGYRRRKGTLSVLTQLARDVAGWPARAVESAPLINRSASLRLSSPKPSKFLGGTVNLRDHEALADLSGAFGTVARTTELRRAASRHAAGRWRRDAVLLFVWRLNSFPVTRTSAACLEQVGPNFYTFSVLGNDSPLFNHPVAIPPMGCEPPGDLRLPAAFTRRRFAAAPAPGTRFSHPSPDCYGLAETAEGRTLAQSVAIWAPGWPNAQADPEAPIPASRIIVADLDGWTYVPPRDHVAIDPERGRIAFPPRQLPKRHVQVSYYYGACTDLGGGEYRRELKQHDEAQVIRVAHGDALLAALKPWQPRADDVARDTPFQPRHAVIELAHSGVFSQPIHIRLAAGHTLQLRAAAGARPVLRLLDWQADRPDNLVVEGEAGSRFTLDGVLVAGRGFQVQGPLASVVIRHSTLVPGWSLGHDCEPRRPSEPSIELIDSGACLVIEHSIVGSIQVNNDEVATEPVTIHISDSIVDATSTDCDGPQCEAIGASGSRLAFAHCHIMRSTVIGRVMTHAIDLAEDSIFMGRITVARRQVGCIRFCYVTPESRTPRRHACQPDGVNNAVGRSGGTEAERNAAMQVEQRRVRPVFDSNRYGTPNYARLALNCAREVTQGAHDESEMGVYHDLYQPQRVRNLRQRVEEFSPAGVEVGIEFAN